VRSRDKSRGYVTLEAAERYVNMLGRFTTYVADPPLIEGLTNDPDDDYLPSLARTAGADNVVTGNTKDMPPDAAARPPIVTPARLLDLLADVAPAAPSARSRQRSAALASWRVRRRRDPHGRGPGHGRAI